MGRLIRLRRHPFIHPRSTDDRSANFRTPLFRAHARLLLPIPATISQLNTWLLVTPKWYVDKINFAEAITIRTSIARALRDDGKIRALLAPTRAPRAPPPRREINSRILVHSPGICRPSHIAFAYPLDLAAILPGGGGWVYGFRMAKPANSSLRGMKRNLALPPRAFIRLSLIWRPRRRQEQSISTE